MKPENWGEFLTSLEGISDWHYSATVAIIWKPWRSGQ